MSLFIPFYGLAIGLLALHGQCRNTLRTISFSTHISLEDIMTKSPEFTLDWPHGHQTRAGLDVRLVCRDLVNKDQPLVFAIKKLTGSEYLGCRRLNGQYFSVPDHHWDIINKPAPKQKIWMAWHVGPSIPYIRVYRSKTGAIQSCLNGQTPFAITEMEVPDTDPSLEFRGPGM